MGSQSTSESVLAAEDGKELDTIFVAQSLFRRTVVDFNDLDIRVQRQRQCIEE
jgi:hypothetical protein